MKYFCNPLNVSYRYQFNYDPRRSNAFQICREAADPSLIYFKGRYYIFASMTLGVWVSDDLANWENHPLPQDLPLYDYAPDVRVMNGWVYFCASRKDNACDRYRTRNILEGPYEKIPGTFPYWDPNLFIDDDGRVYFYWGSSNSTPVCGVELDPETMLPLGERKELIKGHPFEIGYERIGEDHCLPPLDEKQLQEAFETFLSDRHMTEDQVPEDMKPMVLGMLSRAPFIEGAWMDKHNGRYYLQYACPGAEYNTYADGVYISSHPLGPFRLAETNPYSYHPGGFMPGAGHGSTMQDACQRLWHASTMRISVNHPFERRVGLWRAGFDSDGELFCNQRYGDWPQAVGDGTEDPWSDPCWMLLSAGKKASASSFTKGHMPECAVEENVQTWWQAASAGNDEWLMLDLGNVFDIRAIQVNFADDSLEAECPVAITGSQTRWIEERPLHTRWKLEASEDGMYWFTVEDKTGAETDLSHDFIVREDGFNARYLRLCQISVPYDQKPCVSGLRVFGRGSGKRPSLPEFTALRSGGLDMVVDIHPQTDTLGFNILFGASPEKLYHSCMVFSSGQKKIGALIAGRTYYIRVDAFNENGITEGTCVRL